MSEEIIGWKQDDLAAQTALDPYRPPDAVVADPWIEDDRILADRGTRLAARIVDGLLTLAAVVPGFVLMGAFQDSPEIGVALMLIVGLTFIGYQIYLLIDRGQTLGKKMLGVRIVRMDGSRVGAARLFFLRFLVPQILASIPFVGPFVALGGILVIFQQDRRCLHDHLADTKVVVA